MTKSCPMTAGCISQAACSTLSAVPLPWLPSLPIEAWAPETHSLDIRMQRYRHSKFNQAMPLECRQIDIKRRKFCTQATAHAKLVMSAAEAAARPWQPLRGAVEMEQATVPTTTTESPFDVKISKSFPEPFNQKQSIAIVRCFQVFPP